MVINKENSNQILETRNTHQRIKILEYLQSVKTHPSAEQVYSAVRQQMPTITLATIYRNLNLLAHKGTIQRLEVNKEYRYDATIKNHQHAICKKCWKVIDLQHGPSCQIDISGIKVPNFNAISMNVALYGFCKGCET